MIDKKEVERLAQERIDELDKGLYIVELNISSSGVIQLEIDAEEGSVSIEDCISVSRNIEHNLDREKQDFELQVSSAGLDKPLRVIKQYKKNVGREVKVLLKEQHKAIEGVLKHADEEGIVLETATKERLEGKKKKVLVVREDEYKYDQIKETKIVISFKKMK